MYGWPNHTIEMKNRKEIIKIKITLIHKKSGYIIRTLVARLPTEGT